MNRWKNALFSLLLALISITAFGQDPSPQAQFIRDLINPLYISWPHDVGRVKIAIVKNEELYEELIELTEKKFALFKLEVEIEQYNSVRSIDAANIVYVHHRNYRSMDRLLRQFKGQPTLIVGENYPFRSTMINFIDQDGETLIDINTKLISSDIKLRNALIRKNSSSPEKWAELLRIAENEIVQKKAEVRRKDANIKKKQQELDITSDSLKHTEEELDSTSGELVIKSDSLTYSQLVVKEKEDRLAYERNLRIVFIVIIVLILGIVFFVYNIYQTKKEHAEKLAKLNSQITLQKDQLEERNREITDSIKYAQRIQSAIMPSNKAVEKYLKEAFVLFKPKDIVSGDFYWMETVENKVLYAAVDCTGHGVPGAFVSIVGYEGLNRAIREFHLTEPAKIMDKLNEFVDETFEKNAEDKSPSAEVKDGMDMGLCSLDFNTMKLEFAGANNPMYFVRKKENGPLIVNGEHFEPTVENDLFALYEVKPDKQPIGKFSGRHPFANHVIDLKQDDTFYTFSDGYADQFGGPKGKKFKYKPFKELLLKLQHLSMSEQRSEIDKIFEGWKQSDNPPAAFDQIDDVVVFGVRV